jgi:2-keto-4-pentenoate hydratase
MTFAGPEKDRLHQASEILLEARRTLHPIDDLPVDLRPKTLEEAYFIQNLMLQALGAAGGWKVGAPTPNATPLCAPMPRNNFAASGDRIAKQFRRMRGVEGEIAFLLGKDLPPRLTPYSREELVNAIASCHPAMELLESALLDPDKADRLTGIADLQSNGGFVHGAPVPDWQDFDFEDETGQMNVDGFVRVANGKNSAGADLLRLVLWLANEGQAALEAWKRDSGLRPAAGRARSWRTAARSQWRAFVTSAKSASASTSDRPVCTP